MMDEGEQQYGINHWQPWVYASVSILILSLVGLLGILLVPIVNRVMYNHLLQFLVAMAAGSLAGDALLHLLPMALGLHGHHTGSSDHHHDEGSNLTANHSTHEHHDHEHEGEDHQTVIWKCLVCFGGIYAFFLIERLMGLFREFKNRKEVTTVSTTTVEKRVPATNSQIHDRCHTHVVGFKLSGTTANQCVMVCDSEADKNGLPVDQMAMQSLLCGKEEPNSNSAAPEKEELNNHHGHSHSHGHHHRSPTNIASVAWMVVLGDGIHNLIDGLSVGVAFKTVSGGLSTSLAVLLHEIPHELGDFAVLLRAGMSVKMAVFYNLVSSVISFIGMIIGVTLGQLHNTTGSWIFALAAGGFLYIALVDLLPELRPMEAKKGESPLWHLLLQNFGLLTGVGIMVIIAIYEHDIERAIGGS